MKCLTLTQPWATLVAIGAKQIETRSWRTSYRGPLAIHAAKGFPRWAQLLAQEEGGRVREVLNRPNQDLPRGAVVAMCTLRHVGRTGLDSLGRPAYYSGLNIQTPSDSEIAFGDFGSGRFAWVLEDVIPLQYPIAAKGALGLWEWPE